MAVQKQHKVLGLAIAGTALIAGFGVNAYNTNNQTTKTVTVAVPMNAALAPGQVQGPCGAYTPPAVDNCTAGQGYLGHAFWDSLTSASIYQNWKKSNPGEAARLCTGPINQTTNVQTCTSGLMSSPTCPTSGTGQAQTMVTNFGAALANIPIAFACAYGFGPMVLPPPVAPPTKGAADKTPPTAPGPITINP